MSPSINFSTDYTVNCSTFGYTLPYDTDDINLCLCVYIYIYICVCVCVCVYILHFGKCFRFTFTAGDGAPEAA